VQSEGSHASYSGDSSLTLRMTLLFCHPEDFSPKDPSVFSNNQLSLLWMGFFADAQNDSRVLLWMGFFADAQNDSRVLLWMGFFTNVQNDSKKALRMTGNKNAQNDSKKTFRITNEFNGLLLQIFLFFL